MFLLNASTVTKDVSAKRSNGSIAQKTGGEKTSSARSLMRSTLQVNPLKKETSNKRTLEDTGESASVAKKQKKDSAVDEAKGTRKASAENTMPSASHATIQGGDEPVIRSSKRKRTSTESSSSPTKQQSKSKSPTSSGSQNTNDASQGQVARRQRMVKRTESASSSVAKQNAEMSKSSTLSPRHSGKASPGDQTEDHHGTAENGSRPTKRHQSRPVSETPESTPASSKSASQKGKTPPRGKEP